VIVEAFFTIPDVGVGPGPFPSLEWFPITTFDTLTRLGWEAGGALADYVVVLVSATGLDPILQSNPNTIGTFNGFAGQKSPVLTHSTAAPFVSFLRLVPPEGSGAPSVGAKFIFQGY